MEFYAKNAIKKTTSPYKKSSTGIGNRLKANRIIKKCDAKPEGHLKKNNTLAKLYVSIKIQL
jgi:hypothetical protein